MRQDRHNPDRLPEGSHLSALAEKLAGELVGADLVIRGAAGVEHAQPGEIIFIDEASKLPLAEQSQAAAVIVPLEAQACRKPVIRVANPKLAFAQVLEVFAPSPALPVGVHSTAIIGEGARLGKEVAIGAYVVIGDRAEIADGVVIHPQCCLGNDVVVGEGTLLWPQVVVGWGTKIGARCILHSGVVLGADGFGYIWDGERRRKVPQIGHVVIEDDVEIGANTTIDRATTHITRIGRGTKIDDQVHIAHNVAIGEDCVIAGKVGISGSAVIGNRVMIAGQVGLADHVKIGDDAKVLARAAALTDLPAGSVSSGIPAYPHRECLRVEAAARKLPDLLRELRDLQRRLAELEGRQSSR